MTRHVTDETLSGLANGSLSDAQAGEVVRHVVRCVACGHRLDGLIRQPLGEHSEWSEFRASDAFLAALEEKASDALRRDEEARSIVDEIVALEVLPRQTLIRNSQRIRRPEVARHLLERSRSEIFDSPTNSLALATAALEIGLALEASAASSLTGADLLALAWSEVANCRRVLGDLTGASEGFSNATHYLDAGASDPETELRYLELYCILQWECRQYEEALRTNSRLIRMCRQLGQRHSHGTALVIRAAIQWSSKSDPRAVETVAEAIPLLDPDREPRTYYAAHHNLAIYLDGLGQTERAVSVLEQALSLPGAKHASIGLRIEWFYGRLQRRTGNMLAAETALGRVVDGFLSLSSPLAAAEAALELGTLLFELRRFSEVRELAARTLPIFRSQGIHREALAAYTLFVQAAEAETLTQALLTELTQYFGQFKPREARPFRPTGSTG